MGKLTVQYFNTSGKAVMSATKMVTKSLEALKYHKIALQDFDDSRFYDGQQIFRKVAQMAVEMRDLSTEMKTQAEDLKKKAEASMDEAIDAKQVSVEERAKLVEE